MQLYDVFTRKVYELNGIQKSSTYKAGVIKVTDNGKSYLRLFHIPNEDFFIKERELTLPIVDIDD